MSRIHNKLGLSKAASVKKDVNLQRLQIRKRKNLGIKATETKDKTDKKESSTLLIKEYPEFDDIFERRIEISPIIGGKDLERQEARKKQRQQQQKEKEKAKDDLDLFLEIKHETHKKLEKKYPQDDIAIHKNAEHHNPIIKNNILEKRNDINSQFKIDEKTGKVPLYSKASRKFSMLSARNFKKIET